MNAQTKAVATARQMARHTASATRTASRGAWWGVRRYGWAWRGLWRILARWGLWLLTSHRRDGLVPIPLILGKLLATGIGLLVAGVIAAVATFIVMSVTLNGLGYDAGWPVLKAIALAVTVGIIALLALAGRPAILADEPDVYTTEQERLCEAIAATVAGITGTQAVPAASKVGVSKIVGHWNDEGQHVGRQFIVGLPIGTVWEQVNNPRTRGAIAHVLDSRTDRVTVTEGANPGRAHVFVADRSPSEIPAVPWPLLEASRFDLRKPVPIGHAIGGGPVGLGLFSRDSDGDLQAHHAIVFGETGSGKSNLTRLLVLAAVLDPAAKVHVAQKEGSKDFRKLAPGLHWLGDITDTERVTGMLTDAVAHMRAVRAGQAPAVPYLVVLEEAQNQLAAKGPNAHAGIKDMTRKLLAEGRDAAVCVVIVTQRPTSASVDQDVAQRPPNRLAFTVNGDTDARLAMGAKLNDRNDPMRAPQYAVGVHINGHVDALVKVPEIGGKDAERIAGRAAPVVPTVDAEVIDLDEHRPAQPAGLLEHIDSVWPDDERDRLSLDELVWRLGIVHPEYQGWDRPKLRAELRADLAKNGVQLPDKVRIGGQTTPGVTRAHVTAAMGGVEQAPGTTRTP